MHRVSIGSTAAGSGAATASLARLDSATLVVMGAGLQATQHVHAMLHVRPSITQGTPARALPSSPGTVAVVNRSVGAAEQLCRLARPQYPDVTFTPVPLSDAELVWSVDVDTLHPCGLW